MTELTYTVPVVGEENKLAVPKVDTALTEIKTKFNGAIDKSNVAAEVPLIPSTAKWTALKNFTAAEANAGQEISATRPAFLNIFAQGGEAGVGKLEIGGKEVASGGLGEKATGSWPVPAGSKWKINAAVTASWLIC